MRHSDFEKIHSRFIAQFKEYKGDTYYKRWLSKKGYDESKPFSKVVGEFKEKKCSVRGVEFKDSQSCFHVEGLIASSHIDLLDQEEGIEIPDRIPKVTLDSFADQINSNFNSRVMGVHHSEGNPLNPEYFGVADVEKTPARVVELVDGEFGLYVDTKLLKNDPKTPEIIDRFKSGDLNSFSITYDTDRFLSTDFEWNNGRMVRVINPDTKLYGYTAASNPVNPNAIATGYGFKEFKELIKKNIVSEVETKMVEENINADKANLESAKSAEVVVEKSNESDVKVEEAKIEEVVEKKPDEKSGVENKEFLKWKSEQKEKEQKELMNKTAEIIAEGVLGKMEKKEKVLKNDSSSSDESGEKISFELKEFRNVVEKPFKFELKEQFRRAGALADSLNINWQNCKTSAVESREYKNFGVNGRFLEYKGLGLTTNQNTDTDYLQSTAELQDVYDPMIYNALNQETVTWNILSKDDMSGRGNNQIQFTLKIAANTSAGFYTGNAVSSGNVGRLKYQTKFKKVQVGVSVDGDMIVASRGGPVNDVFAQEVLDSTMDMMAVLNSALYAEVGLETASAYIGFEYITDSAGNTTLYNLTRTAANKLAPDSASDTYINQASTLISMGNLRKSKRQATKEGARKSNLVFFTNPVQADLLRGKFDDSRRMLTARDTDFGFSTDLFIDGIPVFEDDDCNTDDWFLVDLETHRIGIWIPPTIEKLGKSADSEDAFVKSYLGVYNRAPRRMVQIYGCAIA